MEKPAFVADDCLPFMDNISDMLSAPYFVENRMEAVSISRDSVEIRKPVLPQDRNSNGFWHGGTIYGVMDHAFAIISNIEGHAVGQSTNLNYYRPGRGDTITAKARFINTSRSLYYVYVEAFDGEKLVAAFIAAKKVEGCSEKTLKYYRATLDATIKSLGKGVRRILTEDLRRYLTEYQARSQASRVTIDNIRRILSSFFSWLEEEDYIVKSPARRIHKVKTASSVKETYADEDLERMRDCCETKRDLAMIDLLASSGMRVGEMVLINRDDINFAERECVVFYKRDIF